MNMSIGEVSKITGLNISTLRYYDKEGLLINVKRDKSGIRIFSEADIEGLRVINCLKKSGMQIKDIKDFMKWCKLGDRTLEKRLNMFCERERVILNEINELQHSLELVKFKKWYYQKAIKDGTEKNVKSMKLEDFPESIRELYKNTH